MPIDKKSTTPSSLFQKRKRHYSAERASKIKLRRHDVYANQSADKKEMLLAQRRSKNIESTSQGLLVEHTEVASSSEAAAELPRKRILTIGESCCLGEKADKSCVDGATACSNKGKNIMGSLSVFEYGSTSNPLDERRDPEASVVIKRGGRSKIIGCWNFKQLPSNATILKTVPNCKYCGAKRFEYESTGFCCSNGSVKLTSYEMPNKLLNLYLGNTEECEHFRTYIRLYNNMFAFTSLGVNYDKVLAKRNHGIYTFRVQDQMYHFINDLIPTNRQPRNLQLYFYDENTEIFNRMASSTILRQSIIEKLMDILKINPYCIFLKSLIHIPELSNFYIALRCGSGLDQRVYNLPTVSEVAALWLEQETNNNISSPHIRIYTRSNKSQIVNYYYGCYDPLQYPLLLPYGQNGWHCGFPKILQPKNKLKKRAYYETEQLPSLSNMCSIDGLLDMEADVLQKGKRKRNNVSCREYYCYKLQMRDNEENRVLHSGRLFQQYSVDEFIKVETQRLDFASFNQDLFRVDVLPGLLDILRLGEREVSKIGKQNFLPTSCTGGPRDMRQRYIDAIALVQHFGKPNIFLTMTCNPSWPEIKEHLLTTDETQNRPDLISRVFRAKVEEMKTDILKRYIFEKVAAFMYTIEFQKRGLPHAHFLVILADDYKLLTPEAYDKFVSAEVPDPNMNSYLHKLVIKHMMHGPCGHLDPTNSCMKKNVCKFKYPRALLMRQRKERTHTQFIEDETLVNL